MGVVDRIQRWKGDKNTTNSLCHTKNRQEVNTYSGSRSQWLVFCEVHTNWNLWWRLIPTLTPGIHFCLKFCRFHRFIIYRHDCVGYVYIYTCIHHESKAWIVRKKRKRILLTESPKKRSNPSCPMDRRASKSCSFVHCLVKMALKVVRGHSSAEGLCVKKLDVTELAISQLIDLSDGWEKARKTPCDSLQTLSSSFCHWRPVSRSSPLRHKARRDQWGPSKRACSCWGTMMRRTGMLIRMRTGQCCGGYKSSCCGRKKNYQFLFCSPVESLNSCSLASMETSPTQSLKIRKASVRGKSFKSFWASNVCPLGGLTLLGL